MKIIGSFGMIIHTQLILPHNLTSHKNTILKSWPWLNVLPGTPTWSFLCRSEATNCRFRCWCWNHTHPPRRPLTQTIILVTVWTFFSAPVAANKLLRACVFFLYRAVFGRLLQTLCDELGSDAATGQIVDQRVHQCHAGSIPPSLRRAFTHLVTEVSHMWAEILFHDTIPSLLWYNSDFTLDYSRSSGHNSLFTSEISTLEVFCWYQITWFLWAGNCSLGHDSIYGIFQFQKKCVLSLCDSFLFTTLHAGILTNVLSIFWKV